MSWYERYPSLYFCDKEGKVLGSVQKIGDTYKCVYKNKFIGMYITEQHAKSAIEKESDEQPVPFPYQDPNLNIQNC